MRCKNPVKTLECFNNKLFGKNLTVIYVHFSEERMNRETERCTRSFVLSAKIWWNEFWFIDVKYHNSIRPAHELCVKAVCYFEWKKFFVSLQL